MIELNGRCNNNCIKTCHTHRASKTLTSSTPNSESDKEKESVKVLITPAVHIDKQTRLLIKTDASQPQKIGLNVNTNVNLKPKKRFNSTNIFNEVLILILMTYALMSYFDIQRLKDEVQVLKLKFKIVEDFIKISEAHLDDSIKKDNANLEKLTLLISNFKNSIVQEQQKEVNIQENFDVSKHLVAKREAENVDEAERFSWNCSSNARTARSVARGPLALHLRGALPEITVRDGGIIAPWYIDKSSSGNFLLANGIVGERKGVLEVVEEGLYYIYAQIYYLTSSSLNSYAINVQLGEGRGREDSVIAVCSAEAATAKLSELSCFTATARYLRRGDRLYVTQRERNRRIIFRDNQSFLGLVLLNSNHNVSNK